MDPSTEPNEMLLRALQHHGCPEASLSESSRWIEVPGHPPANAEIFFRNTGSEDHFQLQLNARFALDDGRVICESVVGLSGSKEEAILKAFQSFGINSLHTILCALYGYPCDDQVSIEVIEFEGENWEVIFGPMATNRDHSVIPKDFSAFVTDQISKKKNVSPHHLHWARFYWGQQNGECLASEALWDNEPWEEAQEDIKTLDWPQVDGFYQVRQFLILRKQGAPEQEGSSNAPVIEKALNTLLSLIEENRQIKDEEIRVRLRQSGVSPYLSSQIVLFGPMCASSVLLPRLGCPSYPTHYRLLKGPSPPSEEEFEKEDNLLSFNDNPVFCVGTQWAFGVSEKESFWDLASRCAIFRAVSSLVSKQTEKDLSCLEFGIPVVVDGSSSPSQQEETQEVGDSENPGSSFLSVTKDKEVADKEDSCSIQ